MTKVVVLDSAPLSLLCGPPRKPAIVACQQWADALMLAGHRIIVPEITDYEVRRELLRAGKTESVDRLNRLRAPFEYSRLTTRVLRRAARGWANARQTGRPTAGDKNLDIDIILVAQAESLRLPNTIIATTNVRHVGRFFAAEEWSKIVP